MLKMFIRVVFLKSLSSMARLIYGEYESNTIAPVIAIDLEKHLYSQYSFYMRLVE